MSLIQTEDHDEGVRVLRLENGKPNAISTSLSTELMAALEAAEKDANAVVITGRAGMFSAGFDLGTMGEGPAAAAEMVAKGGRLALQIYRHPKPIIAAFAPTIASRAPTSQTPANIAMSTTISEALTLYSTHRTSLRPSPSMRS